MSSKSNKIFFSNKKCEEGITNIVDKFNSDLQYIKYSKIFLKERNEVTVSCGSNEVLLAILDGEAAIELGNESFKLCKHDVAYISRDETLKLVKYNSGELSALLFEAPADNKYDPKVIKFNEIKKTISGEGVYEREVYLMVSEENVGADRLILGYCWGMPGGWTGWPPHEHAANLEELYVFYDIQEPGFAVQMIYENLDDIKCIKVQDGDAIAISSGFHPVVAVPGYRMKNVWVMAAKRPIEDRHLSLAKVQAEFK